MPPPVHLFPADYCCLSSTIIILILIIIIIIMRAILSNLLWGKKIGFNITNNKIVVYNSGLGLV